MEFLLTSTAFEDGQAIPRPYTQEGDNKSPPLKWFDPPKGSRSFALICEDRDAPPGDKRTHWLIFNMPGISRELSEGVPHEGILPNGTTQGINDFGRLAYDGPAPLPGQCHHYEFKLFAVDRLLNLAAGTSKTGLVRALEGHILGQAQLVGTYTPGQHHEIPDDPLQRKVAEDLESIITAPLSDEE
jgi:Raf kinase inhibitor-like YbhB/YbcL family protein